MSTETLPEITTIQQPEPKKRAQGEWPVEATWSAWAFLIAGAILRIRAFCHWRSLWVDEIYLAHSVVSRGFWGLISQPLDKWQIAPPGFVLLARLCVDIFGQGERALRLPSLLASLACLPLFYFLARRILPLRAALMAILLFSTLTPMIYYAQELKPYSTEVAVALGITLAIVNCLQKPTSVKAVLVFAAVGVLGIFFAIPAVFVLAGGGLVLFIGRIVLARQKGESKFLAAGPVALALLLFAGAEWLNYICFFKPIMHTPQHVALLKDWIADGGFPPYGPNRALPWIWYSLKNILRGTNTMYLSAVDLSLFAALVGAGSFFAGNRRLVAFLLIVPMFVAIGAAYRHLYPFADRLTLYLVPMLVIFICAGVDYMWGPGGWGRFGMGILAVAMIIGDPLLRVAHDARYPTGKEETKQVYQRVRDQFHAGDAIVLCDMAGPSFDYYAPKTGLSGLTQLRYPGEESTFLVEASAQGIETEGWFYHAFKSPGPDQTKLDGYVVLLADHSANPALYLDEIDHLFHPPAEWGWPKLKRVWVIFTHNVPDHTVDNMCLPELNRMAQENYRVIGDGAEAYLYQVSDTPSAYLKQ